MQLSSIPARIAAIFAASAAPIYKNTVPLTQAGTTQPGQASYDVGFPGVTMQPAASGGINPYGQDFNGILNAMTAVDRWKSAGGNFTFDASFSTTVGGYPKGALILKADGSGFWLCGTDNNTVNPDTVGTGWSDPFAGRLLGVKVFATVGSSTYTPTVGTASVIVEVQGGGGAGGGSPATGATTASVCPGGNAGGYIKSRFTSGFSGALVSVGTGGTGGLGATGGAGAASSFGALSTAPGGSGGSTYPAVVPPMTNFNLTSYTNPSSSGFIIATGTGGRGQPGLASYLGYGGSGEGGFSVFGGGGPSAGLVATPTNGSAGPSYGSGGSGGAGGAGAAASTGGAGKSGIVIIWEYA